MTDDAWIVQQFLNGRGAREISGHGATLGAFERILDRLAAAERERDGWKYAAVEAHNIQNRLGAGNLCLAHDLQTAESRVTRLTEALEKAREGLKPFAQVPPFDIHAHDFDRASATIAAIDAAMSAGAPHA
jgi:hypothetical protein